LIERLRRAKKRALLCQIFAPVVPKCYNQDSRELFIDLGPTIVLHKLVTLPLFNEDHS
jgi:hypothetical protein